MGWPISRRSESSRSTIAFNLLDRDGRAFDIRRVERRADAARISLRTGCICNPGAGETAYGLSAEQIGAAFHDPAGVTFDELREKIRDRFGLEVGAVRVSTGIASNFADVYRFISFLDGFRDRSAAEAEFAAPRRAPGVPCRDGA